MPRLRLLCAKIFALLACLPVAGGSFAATPATTESKPLGTVEGPVARAMDGLLRRAESFGWSGQVLVESDRTIILDRAYGYADRANRIPMSPDTPIGVASISKQFVAAGILALREEGRIHLQDSVSRYVHGMTGDKEAITIDQLLSHTGGLRGGDVAGGDFVIPSRQALIERIATTPLVAAPGEQWRYANAGYNLLAAVIENVTGRPYEHYLAERLFRRAGMQHTGFWHLPPPGSVPAHAYRGWVDQGEPSTWPRNWRVYGSGAVLSTASDLHRWERALRDHAVLTAESVKLLRSPHAAVGDSGDSYGYGWFLHPIASGDDVIEHGGDWLGGYNGFYYVDPSTRLVVLILNNATDASGMWMRQDVQKSLIDIAEGHDVHLPPTVRGNAVGAAVDGEYRLLSGGRIRFFDDGAYLWIAASGPDAVDLLAQADPTESSALQQANAKAERLYAGLACGSRDAFSEALGDEGRPHIDDYRGEWARAVERFGAPSSFEVLGSIRTGDSARTEVLLHMQRRSLVISAFWSERGQGRLHGTYVHDQPGEPFPYPIAYPVATVDDDNLIAYDLFGERGVRIHLADDGRIVIRDLDGGEARQARSLRHFAPSADE